MGNRRKANSLRLLSDSGLTDGGSRTQHEPRLATARKSKVSGLLLLHRLPQLLLGLEPLLPEVAGKPEIHGGERKEEQRQPTHGLGRQESAPLDNDVKAEEGVDNARHVEQHDAFL